MRETRQAPVGGALCPDPTITANSDSKCRSKLVRDLKPRDIRIANKFAPTTILPQKAFTLVELMVAVGVMAILAGILFSAMNQNQNSPRLETAQMVLSQAFANARSQAILKQNRARLIIYSNEPTNEEEAKMFLRYFGVVVEKSLDSELWETALKGEYLPEGIYFIPESSVASLDWNEERPSSRYNKQTMKLAFPSLEEESNGSGPEWSYYEFKSTGRMSGINNKVVLSQGSIGDLKPEFPEPTALVGMVFNGYGLQFPLDEEDTL